MMIKYFISFVYQVQEGVRFGNCIINMKSVIENIKDISDMENKIRQEFKISNAHIINFQKVGE